MQQKSTIAIDECLDSTQNIDIRICDAYGSDINKKLYVSTFSEFDQD